MTAVAFSANLLSSKDTLPTGTCTMPPFSTRYSTFPALISFTVFATSKVTVPVFGLGIIPLGPRIFPSLPTTPMISGVATTESNSSQPFWIFSAKSSAPTWSAPASRASFSFSPFANTRILTVLPVPCGSTTVPRTIWSAFFGSTPRLTARSTLSSNFARAVFFARLIASSSPYTWSLSTSVAASLYFFPATIPPRGTNGHALRATSRMNNKFEMPISNIEIRISCFVLRICVNQLLPAPCSVPNPRSCAWLLQCQPRSGRGVSAVRSPSPGHGSPCRPYPCSAPRNP